MDEMSVNNIEYEYYNKFKIGIGKYISNIFNKIIAAPIYREAN